jgi:peptidyl-prolyl cis-trans isomerase SurA
MKASMTLPTLLQRGARALRFASAVAAAAAVLPAAAQAPAAPRAAAAPRGGDYILAVVNQELVTAAEVERRVAQLKDDARRSNSRLPDERELRRQVLENLIDERVILTNAREAGVKVDDAEVDRAVQAVAAQNQLTLPQLQQRLRQEGVDYSRFRSNLRDQMLVDRMREREVASRIKVSDKEIDDFVAKQAASGTNVEYNIAQILVTVPEGATPQVAAEREARARTALQRVRSGADFAATAREFSEDGNRERGGEIGLRTADRLPDVFVNRVKTMKPGDVAPELLRSGAGFHVLKLLDRKESAGFKVRQTHVRHILLRPTAQLSQEAARQRLAEMKRDVVAGSRRFEDLARQYSQDGSAQNGGDLGWTSPGQLVPEFEEPMNALRDGGVSDPVVSRFGVHLIQVLGRREAAVDPRQLRDQARNALREQKFEEAYNEWVRDLRARAYVEMREPPQ